MPAKQCVPLACGSRPLLSAKENNMRRNYKIEKLENGEEFWTSEKGNSMVPLIKSGQRHKLSPVSWENVEIGNIVYAKVKGCFYTHLVKAKNDKKGCAYRK